MKMSGQNYVRVYNIISIRNNCVCYPYTLLEFHNSASRVNFQSPQISNVIKKKKISALKKKKKKNIEKPRNHFRLATCTANPRHFAAKMKLCFYIHYDK